MVSLVRYLRPAREFVRNRRTTDGLGAYCRPARTAKSKESRERVHGGGRHYHLKRRYGLGADDVEAMLEEQNGVCPICERSLSVKDAHVDHDHKTGCGPCCALLQLQRRTWSVPR